jgi:hypothetical protein
MVQEESSPHPRSSAADFGRDGINAVGAGAGHQANNNSWAAHGQSSRQ